MQFIDFLTFIATMVLITFILRKKKSNQEPVQASNDHVVKSKRTEDFLEREESIGSLDSSSVQTELTELQRLLLGTKRQKKATIPSATSAVSETSNQEKIKTFSTNAYEIVREKKARSAAALIQTAPSKKDLMLIHEIFDKPKSLR